MSRSRISAFAVAGRSAALAMTLAFGLGAAPSVVDLDASARASGNRLDIATHIGDRVFARELPAQVSQISANQIGSHLVIGVRMWGVKFHRPITRDEFVAEVADVVRQAFAAAPQAEEVDVWTSVPIATQPGLVVSGDLAQPTVRTVFSASVKRSQADPTSALTGSPAYWDEQWAASAFQKPEVAH